jgi:hypothetical protein
MSTVRKVYRRMSCVSGVELDDVERFFGVLLERVWAEHAHPPLPLAQSLLAEHTRLRRTCGPRLPHLHRLADLAGEFYAHLPDPSPAAELMYLVGVGRLADAADQAGTLFGTPRMLRMLATHLLGLPDRRCQDLVVDLYRTVDDTGAVLVDQFVERLRIGATRPWPTWVLTRCARDVRDGQPVPATLPLLAGAPELSSGPADHAWVLAVKYDVFCWSRPDLG